jgi:hypothetical protein
MIGKAEFSIASLRFSDHIKPVQHVDVSRA